jgi:hypothetical protein
VINATVVITAETNETEETLKSQEEGGAVYSKKQDKQNWEKNIAQK